MTKRHIYITRKIDEALLQPYKHDFTYSMWEKEDTPVPRDVLLEEAKKASGVLCLITENIDEQFLNENRHLDIIANMAVGYDNIDVKKAKEHNIIVTNTPDVLTETTADLTFALLMATARRLIEANHYIKEDKWVDWAPFMLAGNDIHHKTIGIVGMGRIGEAVARRAKGFNMNVIYHNRSRREAVERELGAAYVSFEKLLQTSDFVVSLVPLTEETDEIFNEAAFSQMKRDAIFINASRGGVVDEKALYNALKTRKIKAAGLDVFKEEPITSNHPLMQLDNVVALPHIGSASIETREEMLKLSLDNIKAVLSGKEPLTEVKV